MIIAVGNDFRCFLRSSCCAFHNFCLVRLRFSQVFINAVRFVNREQIELIVAGVCHRIRQAADAAGAFDHSDVGREPRRRFY